MKKILSFAAILLLLTSVFACGKENEEEIPDERDGIIPSSIEQVADVIELKYGEEKEWRYNGQAVKFTVTEVQDNLIDWSTMYIAPEYQEEFFKRTRMFADLRIETNHQSECLKVSSKRGGVDYYKNDGLDIQEVWDIVESWSISGFGQEFFMNQFPWKFGTGVKFENIPFSIYMAKADPIACRSGYNVVKSQYKFIFIVTKN
jgi:hypothetical protein